MNTERLTFSGPVHKVKKAKKHKGRHKKIKSLKFDKQGFLFAWAIGIAASVAGVLMIGSTQNAPSGVSKSVESYNLSSLEHILPETTKDLLIFLLGNVFMLLGLISIFIGVKIFARFLSDKLKR